MFRKMRRLRQLTSEEEAYEYLKNGETGVLACIGDEGYPYAVPLNYILIDDVIYFHSAIRGHKIDAIVNNPKVSFCVIKTDKNTPEKLTNYYESVIVFGKASIIKDENEIIKIMKSLGDKFSPNLSDDHKMGEIKRELMAICLVGIKIEHITGKRAIELVKNNN